MPTREHRLVHDYYNIIKAQPNNAEFKQLENDIFHTNTSHSTTMYLKGDQFGCPSHANVQTAHVMFRLICR